MKSDLSPSDVCVIIPAYNEEKNIERVVSAVRASGHPVLVIDDGSKDRTVPIVKALGVECLVSQANAGKGASLRKGLEHLRGTGCRGAILMDADGQHDPNDLPLFVEALSRADLVVGNRMDRTKGMPIVRVATNRLMSWMISKAAGAPVPDTQCGYRALSRRAIETIRLATDRFETESEMIFAAARAGLKIASVPVKTVYADEVSHIRPARDTVRFLRFYLKNLLQSR